LGVSANFDVAVLGGGASGIASGIAAGRAGKSVVICERLLKPGKKILASGNGRCNLLNENIDESFYNPASRALVKNIFAKFGKEDIFDFFSGLGLHMYSDCGRMFPVTNQSSSVLKVLEMEIKRLAVRVETGFDVKDIAYAKNCFVLSPGSGNKISASSLIVACGGRSYPSFGSDGSGYKFAERFGHKIIHPVPCAVPLVSKDPLCHPLQGQKISASAKVIAGGSVAAQAQGEVLFTKYGLSGTAILDVSRQVSISINRDGKKQVYVVLDMVPFMDEPALTAEIQKRLKIYSCPDDLLAGIVPNKFAPALLSLLKTKDAAAITHGLKAREFIVTGTRGWNEADFTAGGVSVDEVNIDTLESNFKKGLYFTGEILDVDGVRGGYNLAWAWASGFIAGRNA